MEGVNFNILFILSLSFLAFDFSLYKYDIMADCLLHTRTYKIFPWSTDAQVSNSHIGWLFIHLTSALFHVVITGFYMATRSGYNVFIVSHYIFMFIIIINIWHFLQYNFVAAISINMIPLLIMSLSVRYDYMIFYFLSLLSPVIIEVIDYIKS